MGIVKTRGLLQIIEMHDPTSATYIFVVPIVLGLACGLLAGSLKVAIATGLAAGAVYATIAVIFVAAASPDASMLGLAGWFIGRLATMLVFAVAGFLIRRLARNVLRRSSGPP
jgi:hypothetical protein